MFVLLVVGFTAVCSAQILVQVFGKAPVHDVSTNCRQGLLALIGAVRRARAAAAAETGGERAALARFRAALEPEWSDKPTLDVACRSDAEAQRALGEIELLRYAEEHAVRYEAVDLAPRRRRVRALEERLEHNQSLTDARHENP